ncbi:hypothetical protein SUREIYA_00990 [Serratia phage vB_SmaM-Sureiya]|nr:hypothetical protein SUREIYA_00990 [Serratia phage vB_SmaM-Sureiya]
MATLVQKASLFEGVDLGNKLQEASRSMSETVSGLTTQLINPFKSVTEATESGVALISEKQSQIASNISAYKSQALTGINNAIKGLTGGLLNIGDIGSIVTYQDGFKVNTDELLRLGSKGLGFNVNSMRDLKQQIGDGFINELDKMTGGLASGLFFADGTKLHIADGWKMNMGMSLIDFLGKDDPDGFGTIVNVAAMNSILNTMLDQTVGYGMWQGYGNYGNMYLFQSDYHDQLIDSLGLAIGRGDCKSIQAIFDIIKQEGINKVKAKYPDLIEQMLSNFTFSSDEDAADYEPIKKLLLEVIETVGGKNWYQYPTSFGPATNLGMVNFISDDAKLLLSEENNLIPLLCSSGIFIDQAAPDVFMQDFPKAVEF